MKRTLLSVSFPASGNTGRVLVVDGLIDRTSYNMRRWIFDIEEHLRWWCKEHNIPIEETPCPDVPNHIDYEGNEIEEE